MKFVRWSIPAALVSLVGTLALASPAAAADNPACPSSNFCLYLGESWTGGYTGISRSIPDLRTIGWDNKARSRTNNSGHAVVTFSGYNYTGNQTCTSSHTYGPQLILSDVSSVYVTAQVLCH